MEILSQIAYWTAYTVVVGGIIIIIGEQIVRDTIEMFREQPREDEETEETQEETL